MFTNRSRSRILRGKCSPDERQLVIDGVNERDVTLTVQKFDTPVEATTPFLEALNNYTIGIAVNAKREM